MLYTDISMYLKHIGTAYCINIVEGVWMVNILLQLYFGGTGVLLITLLPIAMYMYMYRKIDWILASVHMYLDRVVNYAYNVVKLPTL